MSLDLLQKKNSTDIKGEILTETRKREIIPAEMITQAILLTKHPGEIVQLNLGEWLIPFDHEKMDIKNEVKPQLDEIAKAIRELNVMVKIEVDSGIGESVVCDLDLYNRRTCTLKNYLIKNGVLAHQLFTYGYGKNIP
jgi:hypothetical protein